MCLVEIDFKEKMQRLIFNFIWGKSERIKHNTLIGNINEGSLSIIDIESKHKALKAPSRVPKLLNFKSIFYEILNECFNGLDIDFFICFTVFKCRIRKLKVSLFYKQVCVLLMNHCKIKGLIRYTVEY